MKLLHVGQCYIPTATISMIMTAMDRRPVRSPRKVQQKVICQCDLPWLLAPVRTSFHQLISKWKCMQTFTLVPRTSLLALKIWTKWYTFRSRTNSIHIPQKLLVQLSRELSIVLLEAVCPHMLWIVALPHPSPQIDGNRLTRISNTIAKTPQISCCKGFIPPLVLPSWKQ